jgi:hypothetical protein
MTRSDPKSRREDEWRRKETEERRDEQAVLRWRLAGQIEAAMIAPLPHKRVEDNAVEEEKAAPLPHKRVESVNERVTPLPHKRVGNVNENGPGSLGVTLASLVAAKIPESEPAWKPRPAQKTGVLSTVSSGKWMFSWSNNCQVLPYF